MFGQTFGAMLETLSQPQTRHAAMVHLPIAVALLGILALCGFAVTVGRSKAIYWFCVVLYVVGAAVAWMAHEAGEEAVAMLDTSVMTESALERLETHEEMGERVWIWLAVTAAITASTRFVIGRARLRAIVLVVAVLASFASAAYVAVTAHHGGALVYEYGVGTPRSPNNLGSHGLDPTESSFPR